MSNKEALLALADRVEAAAGSDRELDTAIAKATGARQVPIIQPWTCARGWPLFTSSLDAALALVPEGWCKTVADYWCEGEDKPPFFADCGDLPALKRGENATIVNAYAVTPALALTAAALRARAAIL